MTLICRDPCRRSSVQSTANRADGEQRQVSGHSFNGGKVNTEQLNKRRMNGEDPDVNDLLQSDAIRERLHESRQEKGEPEVDYQLFAGESVSAWTCNCRKPHTTASGNSKNKRVSCASGTGSYPVRLIQYLILSFVIVSGASMSVLPGTESLSRAGIEPAFSSLSIRIARSAKRSGQSDKTNPSKRDIRAYINGHRNPQRLATKMGFYVEIKRNGKVKGNRRQTPYSVIEMVSIQTGVIAIRGKKSGRYLAMDKRGRLVGLTSYTSASNFHESLIENNYFVFYQEVIDIVGRNRRYKREVYMGFDKRGRPKRGKKVQRNDSSAHFQKLKAVYPPKQTSKKRRRSRKGKKKSRGRNQRSRRVKSA